ncbi:MAG TPA: DUF4349 domain-containing protein [Nitrososphaerales archaeon]|nr:DUF4349 domain-containing protein [Nitrososphaerales archaeon]
MNRLGGLTARTALLGLAAIIVVGGFALALISGTSFGLFGSFSAAPLAGANNGVAVNQWVGLNNTGSGAAIFSDNAGLNSNVAPSVTRVVGQISTTTVATSTSYPTGGAVTNQTPYNLTQGAPGGLIEFSTDLSMRTSAPEQTASGVVALAYSVGGYVAYQTTYSNSAYVVIRVPAGQDQQVLSKVEAMGTVVSLTSNSNDVTVQYTDLNATLASLRTEQGALLRLLNQSASINSTLAIETQLQGVNQQINDIESQILQTKTLINYATIDVTVTETAQQTPLSVVLSATPKNGTAPLSVTFNAVVKGGAQPYVVDYNFGDGYATEGQIVIHTYYQAGDYRVSVSTTDQNGTVAQAFVTVHVVAAPTQSNLVSFFGTVSNLFVNVIEGIVEVAVVVLPLAAVGAAVIIPIQRRGRAQRPIKQSQ